ncbi:MAG TPA: AAA family ATPase [Clostridiaceae bacterium]|nr:AAA family ATPase [Clostridiaceae bacterium]
MFILPGYVICEQIHENNRIKVYRGFTARDRMPVIIKAFEKEAADPLGISRFLHQYEITRDLNIEGIISPIKLEQTVSHFALIMKDVGAISLREYIQNNPVNLKEFLEISIQLTGTLSQLHQKGIIHRDLKPENILVNSGTGKVYIIDFSSALSCSGENKNKVLVTNGLVGTPEYMSPEQTGRLNIETDQRSDLYSLGVVFYEIITGHLPLQAENPAEWINAHITQQPQPPNKLNPDIPDIICDIIMKLLEKAAHERYQSAYGILWDLKECKRLLMQTGRIEFFSIGQADASARFQIPHNLYGREKERAVLKDAFERACEGSTQIVLVSGYPGIGKTMLVSESLKSFDYEKGYFVMGKCDQLMHNIPYAPMATAFGNLVKQLMTEDQEELNKWKKRIMHALGRNGAVVTNIIPELEYIIGKQNPVDVLSPKEAENRFMIVFRDFVKVFAWKGHPLVLFLDDLQWMDPACVHLLKYLTCDANLRSLLFIGAFRDNEVDEDHPLKEMLEEVQKGRHDRQCISLLPLDRSQVQDLVAGTLHTELNKVVSLSDMLYRKSGGNPFFLVQLLRLIHDEALLYFDRGEGCWKWDLETIRKLQPGEDVLELLMRKLQRLPEDTLEILKLAACIGNKFDMETLASVCGKSSKEMVDCLMPSVLEGLVLTAENQNLMPAPEYREIEHSVFEFLHDRVQQAVYSLIPEDEKKKKHLSIGQLLLKDTDSDNLEEKILSIMDHFNRSLELIVDFEERMKLAKYNLLAGRKAKASAAYASALQYFRTGQELLPDDAWEQAYKLSFDLSLELAQMEYLSANVKVAEELFDTVIEKTKDELESASVYGLKVMLYAEVGKYAEAVHTGIYALEKLGVRLPLYPTKVDYLKEMLFYKWYMRNKKIEDLVHLPEMTNPKQRKIAELLTRLTAVTMTSYPDFFSFIILKTGNFAVRHGNTEMTSIGYLGHSITAGSVLGDYNAGDEYRKVCISLAEKYDRSSSKCIIYFVIGVLISHWTQDAAVGLEYLKKAVISGIEAGDVLIIGYAHCLLLEIPYLMGVPLEKVSKEVMNKREIAERLKHETLANNVAVYEKLVSVLVGEKTDSLASGVAEFQKNELPQLIQRDQSPLATYYIYEMYLCYMIGNYRDALAAAQKVEPLKGAIIGFLISVEYVFYYSLVITAAYKELPVREKERYVKVLRKNQKRMKRWSETCQKNFEHKYLLVAAEVARIQDSKGKAMSLYDSAIQSARENGYIQYEALANELAARFYLSQGIEKVAEMYMQDACNGYFKWGAYVKVKELQERYPKFLEGIVFERQSINNNTEFIKKISSIPTPSDSDIKDNLDTYFINKIVENIFRETDINNLLKNFLDIAAQSIGADRGYLLFEKDGELFIEAVKDSNLSETVIKTIPLEEDYKLSKAVVRYVARTLETVVLSCDDKAGIFAGDPYIAESDPKSIACLPLLFRGVPFGILYFENSFIPGVFSPDRLESLRLLSSQIAYVKRLQTYLEKNDSIIDKKRIIPISY